MIMMPAIRPTMWYDHYISDQYDEYETMRKWKKERKRIKEQKKNKQKTNKNKAKTKTKQGLIKKLERELLVLEGRRETE